MSERETDSNTAIRNGRRSRYFQTVTRGRHYSIAVSTPDASPSRQSKSHPVCRRTRERGAQRPFQTAGRRQGAGVGLVCKTFDERQCRLVSPHARRQRRSPSRAGETEATAPSALCLEVPLALERVHHFDDVMTRDAERLGNFVGRAPTIAVRLPVDQ